MSVTLKLADEDAAVIGSILRAVGQVPDKQNPEDAVANYRAWFFSIRNSHTNRPLEKILELAGAFKVAVRANER